MSESRCQVTDRLHVLVGFFCQTFLDYSLCSVCVFPKSAILILHFALSLRFTLSLNSLHFTPGPQSAVRSPQSAVFPLH